MNYLEEATLFHCAGEPLLGIVAQPAQPRPCGVLIVVGGPQYRVGSHRQFLLLARRLAAAGYPVMRFDCRGMGDGQGEARDFLAIGEDIEAARNHFFERCPSMEKVVLWGLCDGASAALLDWSDRTDPRLAGLCLLNPWVRSDNLQARTQIKHYYGQRLLQWAFWRKLLRGQVPLLGAAKGLYASLRKAFQPSEPAQSVLPFQARMAQATQSFTGPILLILSGKDYTAKEFIECANADPAWAHFWTRPRLERRDLADADHTFSRAQWRAEVEELTLAWLAQIAH